MNVTASSFPHIGYEQAWQDGLDLIAVFAGLKPVCLVGRGGGDEAWCETLRGVAVAADIDIVEAGPWEPEGDLPAWYLDATVRRRAKRKILYFCRDEAVAKRVRTASAQGRISVDTEAALLGYPRCCVAQHHERTLTYERLLARRTERIAKDDPARMTRLIEAGVEPIPETHAEWEEVRALTRITQAEGTSVNMCDACAADPASPAMKLVEAYATLARRARYRAL
ncbi:MAG TPA: hypothetical protein VL993_00635 [Stellaceae bacterium]|nr:hypothetical protein [Stellaceae bacterium]